MGVGSAATLDDAPKSAGSPAGHIPSSKHDTSSRFDSA